MTTNTPTIVDIGICTFRRPQLADMLASIAALALPFNCTIRIIVADNDESPSAQIMVAEETLKLGLNITYIHAPAKNISIARNACLAAAKADYLAFIDDDELVDKQWLTHILTTQRDTLADIVLGPVHAVYLTSYPKWLLAGDYHSTKPYWVNGKIITGYAGNVLMKRNSPALQGLHFREDLGVTGGEDFAFFLSATNAGATIAYAPEAAAFEAVPPERASMRWLMQRRIRYGETLVLPLIEARKQLRKNALKYFIKAIACYALMVLFCFTTARRTWQLRGTLHLGAARSLWRAAKQTA